MHSVGWELKVIILKPAKHQYIAPVLLNDSYSQIIHVSTEVHVGLMAV